MVCIIPSFFRNVHYLNTEQFLDKQFWLKLWLKLNSFGSLIFHLAKVLATTNSIPG